eukprot:2671136-Rhodomonas_salina.6
MACAAARYSLELDDLITIHLMEDGEVIIVMVGTDTWDGASSLYARCATPGSAGYHDQQQGSDPQDAPCAGRVAVARARACPAMRGAEAGSRVPAAGRQLRGQQPRHRRLLPQRRMLPSFSHAVLPVLCHHDYAGGCRLWANGVSARS